jgi:hypothetical protein
VKSTQARNQLKGIPHMSRKVIIELSLIEESNNKPENNIIKDIVSAFSKEDFVIPWCKQFEKIIILKKTNQKV